MYLCYWISNANTQILTHTHTHTDTQTTHTRSILNLFAIYFISLACGMRHVACGERTVERCMAMSLCQQICCCIVCLNCQTRVSVTLSVSTDIAFGICSQGNKTAERKMLTSQQFPNRHTTETQRVKFPMPQTNKVKALLQNWIQLKSSHSLHI